MDREIIVMQDTAYGKRERPCGMFLRPHRKNESMQQEIAHESI
jgi:hypothetical protein